MNEKNMPGKIIADVLFGVTCLFFCLMAIIWGYNTPAILSLVVLIFVTYWRFRVFPVTGFALIKFWTIYGALGLVAGLILGVASAFVGASLGFQMQHGLSFVLVFGAALFASICGVIVGYFKYRKAMVSAPSKYRG